MKKRNSTAKSIVIAAVAAVVMMIKNIILNHKVISYHISDGNLKLKPNAETMFIIWNIPAVFTCPYATDDCIEDCYARNAENRFPETTLGARVENFLLSKTDDFVSDMTTYILKKAAGTKKKFIIVRIHESGDFYNRKYAQKWLQIARNCAHDKRIRFIAYTKSYPFFDGVKLPKNFSLRFSIWAGTDEKARDCARRNKWNIYTAVPKFEIGDTFTRCRCSDCATCRHCWQNYKDIRCEIH